MKYYLLCDESGRLGYTDKVEKSPGEFSVVAGAIIPHELFCLFGDHLKQLLNKYRDSIESVNKFHITDLETEIEQQNLRQDIFDLLSKFRIRLVYAAIYLKPFSEAYEKQRVNMEQSFVTQKALGFTIDKNMGQFRHSLQAECFSFMYTKTVCELINYHSYPIVLSVITDEIDNKTLKSYQSKIDERHCQKRKAPLKGKKYHPASGETQRIEVSSNITIEDPRTDLLMSSCGIISKEGDINSIVADVIANSVNYYLTDFVKTSGFGALNSTNAIEKHPLSSSFIVQEDSVMDKIYAY